MPVGDIRENAAAVIEKIGIDVHGCYEGTIGVQAIFSPSTVVDAR